MNSNQKISQLKQIIYQQLTPLIDHDYYLLEVPYYTNIGDVLIWQGEVEFLKNVPHRCLGFHDLHTFQFPEIPKDAIILLQGGGNFGTLWLRHHKFREKVVNHYPDNKIIVMPQTVFYDDYNALRYDASIYHHHKNLTICARDEYSYNLLKRFNVARDILLVPDMAFCINPDSLNQYSLPTIGKNLFMKRLDKELAEITIKSDKEFDTHDWPTFEASDEVMDELDGKIREHSCDTDVFANDVFRPYMVKKGVELISKYDTIFTTRLHGCILSILLDKPIVFVNNNNDKNYNFYNTWLKDLESVSFSGKVVLQETKSDFIHVLYTRLFVLVNELGLLPILRKLLNK